MWAWILLVAAIVFEVGGTLSMKLSAGFSRLLPSVLIFVFYGLSFTAMTFSLKKIDVSLAYAVWSGLGTSLVAVLGIFLFHEPANLLRLGSIALIILGCVGLRLS